MLRASSSVWDEGSLKRKVVLLCFSILQVNLAWENLDKTWKERVERLEEAMQAAVQFQDGLQVFPITVKVVLL